MQLNRTALEEGWSTETLLSAVVHRVFPGKIAVVSSFGAESAVLLHLVAGVDRSVPVVFLDTGKLFAETLRYRDTLVGRLGLTDVRSVRPDPAALREVDPDGTLWRIDPSLCCWHRKVEPLDMALEGFEAWITGRKRFQGGQRQELELIESGQDGRTKVNPLAFWDETDLVRVCQAARFAAASARGAGLSLDRLRGLHPSGAARRAAACRPLGRTRQDGVRHS